MASTSLPYILGPDEGDARWGVDGALTAVKASGLQTGGRLAVIEDLAPQGGGTRSTGIGRMTSRSTSLRGS